MGRLSKVLALPSFLLSVAVFYWSSTLLQFFYFDTTSMTKPRNDMYAWALLLKRFFRVKVLRYGSTKLYKTDKKPVAYLCNHRSWADFFIDIYLTQGNASLLSRWLVFWVFPVFMTSARILCGILLFKRGHIVDKKKFNEWLDSSLAKSQVPGLLVYPEGHRSTKPTSLPLKRGMLHYIHSRKMPVQIIISCGKEVVMSEKLMSAAWGKTVVTSFSEPIFSEGKEFEAFAAEINSVWDKMWKEVYAADPTGLTLVIQEDIPEFDYTKTQRIGQLIAAYFVGIPLMFLWLFSVARFFKWFTGLGGLVLQQVGLIGLASWLFLSLLLAQA